MKEKAKKRKYRNRPIVTGYLEKVSSSIFDQHSRIIAEMIQRQQGLYALYRKEKLYYVGLARNLKSRVKQHVRDKHAGKWTHFSLYIIRHPEHIKELESLLLRIAYPAGNSVKGKLRRSGSIRFNGKSYDSPSAAGTVARGGKHTNGWVFWQVKQGKKLVRLKEFRK